MYDDKFIFVYERASVNNEMFLSLYKCQIVFFILYTCIKNIF